MAAETGQNFIAVMAGLVGALIGAIVTAIGHLLRSRASMSSLVDARIRFLVGEQRKLIDEQAKRIVELQDEVKKLEKKIDCLDSQLQESRRQLLQCKKCGKWVAGEEIPKILAAICT